jgi:hypothetical protein
MPCVRIGENFVAWAHDLSEVYTLFPDGSELYATPNHDPESLRNAASLGYGDDTARMSRDHEVSHTFLAVVLGLPFSPTLYNAARPGHADDTRRRWEEALVFDFQRLLHDPAYDSHTFACLWVIGRPPSVLRADFIALLDGVNLLGYCHAKMPVLRQVQGPNRHEW